MKWLEWLRQRVDRFIHDLLAEAAPTDADRVREFLEAAQAQLGSLELDLAEATAHEKCLELEWRTALDRLQLLDEGVDRTLQAGDEAAAQAYLEQAQRWQRQAGHLEAQVRTWAQVTHKLRTALGVQRTRLSGMRRDYRELTEREQEVEMLERLQAWQREVRRAARLHTQLRERHEQIAQREDRMTAREELGDKTLE